MAACDLTVILELTHNVRRIRAQMYLAYFEYLQTQIPFCLSYHFRIHRIFINVNHKDPKSFYKN